MRNNTCQILIFLKKEIFIILCIYIHKVTVMSDDLLNKITQALDKTQHPSINASLPQLGMVSDVKIEDNKVHLKMKLPFAGIPENVRNIMVGNIQDVLNPFGMNIKIHLAIMNEEEKQKFLQIENANWKGAP